MGEVNEGRALGRRERAIEIVALKEGLVGRGEAILKEEMSAKDIKKLQERRQNQHPIVSVHMDYNKELAALHSFNYEMQISKTRLQQ